MKELFSGLAKDSLQSYNYCYFRLSSSYFCYHGESYGFRQKLNSLKEFLGKVYESKSELIQKYKSLD